MRRCLRHIQDQGGEIYTYLLYFRNKSKFKNAVIYNIKCALSADRINDNNVVKYLDLSIRVTCDVTKAK